MPDLLLPDGVTAQDASRGLHEHLTVRDRDVTVAEVTFYDTFDALLHRGGLTASHQDGTFTVTRDGCAIEAAWATPPRRLLAIELDDSPLRAALEPVIGVRALLAQAQVRIRSYAFDVLDGARKTVVRLTLEEPSLVASERRLIALAPRIRLTGVRGYDDELAAVHLRLQHGLGLAPAKRPMIHEAVAAAGGRPEGHSSRPRVPLSFQQPSGAAAVAVLLALFEVIDVNRPGTVADVDAEFLHDFRVAIRRSRAVQRELKEVFPPAELERFRTEFRWLQQSTGAARDMDVYVLEFDSMRALVPEAFRSDLEPLLGVLRQHRLTARREMVRALRSDRAQLIWEQWPEFLRALADGSAAGGPAAAEPIGALAGKRIANVYRRMVRMGREIDDRSPPEALHELRKKGKELRYLLELFGSELYPSDVVKPMVKTLKGLQDVLGRHQDREVQATTLRGLREEVSALPGGPAALMTMGLLVERVGADQIAARDAFAATFAEFASKSQRRLVKQTFG